TIVDALFQGDRLEWVLSGRYYFTQTMPDGVRFPYAIALYVFSMPWTYFTRDYVTLLRIVVCAAGAPGGGCCTCGWVRRGTIASRGRCRSSCFTWCRCRISSSAMRT